MPPPSHPTLDRQARTDSLTCLLLSCSKSKYRLAAGDLPDARRLAKRLSEVDIRRYDKLDKSRVVNLAEEFSDYLSVKLEEARTSATPPTSHKGWR